MRWSWLALTLSLAIASSSAGDARAANDEAAAIAMERAANGFWDDAERQVDPARKRAAFADAAKAYEEAHRLDPRFERIRSAASAWKNAGDDARAAESLEEALRQSPPDADREQMERLLASLDRSLGRIVVRGPAGTRVTVGARTLPVPVSIRSNPGDVVVHATLPDGRIEDRTVTVRAGAPTEIVVGEQPAPRRDPPSSIVAPPAADVDDGPRPTLVAGAVLLGVGLAGGVATGVLAGLGYAADDEAEADGPGSPSIQTAIDFQRASWAVGVPSVAASVAGALLLIVDSLSSSPTRAAVGPCLGAAPGVSFCGRF